MRSLFAAVAVVDYRDEDDASRLVTAACVVQERWTVAAWELCSAYCLIIIDGQQTSCSATRVLQLWLPERIGISDNFLRFTLPCPCPAKFRKWVQHMQCAYPARGKLV